MKEKIILEGVFQKFSEKTINRPYYTKEEFQKAIDDLKRKEFYKKRKDIA